MALPLLGAAKGSEGVYFAGGRQFLDTIIIKGTDRFGRKQTPVFASLWIRNVRAAESPGEGGLGVPAKFRASLPGFRLLLEKPSAQLGSDLRSGDDPGAARRQEATGDKKYARAADAYLDFSSAIW